MGYTLPDNYTIEAPKPIDDRLGVWENLAFRPYHNIAEAFTVVGVDRRADGLPVRIGISPGIPYVFTPGTMDQGWDLVPDKQVVSVKVIPGQFYTILPADEANILSFTSATAVQVTIPPGLPVAFRADILQDGDGIVTFVPGTVGVSVRGLNGMVRTTGKYSYAQIISVATDVWDIASGSAGTIAGRTIYVDTDSVNATDTRAGISNFSQTIPFKTITAALAVATALSNPASFHVQIYVLAGVYAENVVGQVGDIKLAAGVIIQGTVHIDAECTIIGESGMSTSGIRNYPISLITSGDPNWTLYAAYNTGSSQTNLILQNIVVENTGNGTAVKTSRIIHLRNCTILANNGIAMDAGPFNGVNIERSWVSSQGNYAVLCTVPDIRISTIITNSPTHDAISMQGQAAMWIEESRIYSANGRGCTGTGWGGTVVFRNNFCNTFNETIFAYAAVGGVSTDGTVEVVGNVMNVRNPAVTEAFHVHVDQNPIVPTSSPMIMDNRFNKAQFYVYVNALLNTQISNAGSIPMAPTYPRIANVSSVSRMDMNTTGIGGAVEVLSRAIVMYVTTAYSVFLLLAEVQQLDLLVQANTPIPDIETYLSSLGYGPIDLSGLPT